MQRFDILWKAILESNFEDFLTFFYPNASEYFDFDRGIVFLDKELNQLFPDENKKFRTKIVDKLVKVQTHEGAEQWILVHIEVQSSPAKNFAYRMYRYFSRIKDRYEKPIAAFAILADANANFKPKMYQEEFFGTGIQYHFNSYKILDQEKEELEKNPNPFACVILAVKAALHAKKKGDKFRYQFKKELYNEFKNRDIPEIKKRAILYFLDQYVSFDNQELENKFEEEVKIKGEKTMNMDDLIREDYLKKLKKEKQEALKQEREKARIERENAKKAKEDARKKELATARNLKNAGVDIKIIAEATGLSIDEIQQL